MQENIIPFLRRFQILSRLCMLMIGCCHIGEVQVSLWDDNTLKVCEEAGVQLL